MSHRRANRQRISNRAEERGLVLIHVPYQRVNEIINGRRGITPSTALRLAKVFGVSADFWMNIQLRWDLYFAMKSESDALNAIKPLPLIHLDTNKSSTQYGAGH